MRLTGITVGRGRFVELVSNTLSDTSFYLTERGISLFWVKVALVSVETRTDRDVLADDIKSLCYSWAVEAQSGQITGASVLLADKIIHRIRHSPSFFPSQERE